MALPLKLFIALSLYGFGMGAVLSQPVARLSDSQIRKILIKQSAASFKGECPCPYSRTDDNKECGERSAYSKASAPALLCYEKDVAPIMLRAYRRSGGQ